MQLYIEHPNQNRIRDLESEPGAELIIEVNVSAQYAARLGYSQMRLERLATQLLRDHLADSA